MIPLITNLRIGALLVFLSVFSVGSSSAQTGVSVSAGLSPAAVSVGQEGTYTITVNGAGVADSYPKKIKVDGVEVIFRRSGRSFRIINGRSVQRATLTYSVSAQKEGKFTIPAQAIGVGKGSYQTNSVVLTVRRGLPATIGEKPTLKIEVSKREIFVGEVIPVALVVEVPAGVQFRPMEHPKFNPEGFAVKRFELPVPGVQRDGWGEYRYESSLSAISPGKLTLARAELAFSVSRPPQGTSRSPFTRGWSSQNYRMKTEPVTFTVKPLPTDRMPSSFQGAVGQFTMKVTASPTELQVNDPLIIDSKITGIGNFDRLTAPKLSDSDGWKLQSPREYMENRSNGLQRGTTAFSQVVQPLRIFDALPALEFSYFDPVAERYVTLNSKPVPLTIVHDDSPPTRVEGKDFSTPEASIPEEELGDILTIFQYSGKLKQIDGSDAPVPIGFRVVVVASLLSIVAILCFGLRRIWKERQEEMNRRKWESENRSSAVVLEEILKGGKPAKEFYALAGECISAVLMEREEAARARLERSPELRMLREKAQFYHYGASAGKAAEAINSSEREQVIECLRGFMSESEVKGEQP